MQMCIQTHPPRGELNATLEIVFSTQVYLAVSVDSVWWEYFCHLHKVKLLPKIDPGVFQEEILWEAGRGKTFISVFYLSFCTRQANCLLTSGRWFKASPTKKVLFVGPGRLLQTQKHLVNPRPRWAGGIVCVLHRVRPSPVVYSFPLTPVHADTNRRRLLGTWAASPQCIRPSAYLESICSLPLTDSETVGLSVASLSVSFLDWGGEGQKGGGSGRR